MRPSINLVHSETGCQEYQKKLDVFLASIITMAACIFLFGIFFSICQ